MKRVFKLFCILVFLSVSIFLFYKNDLLGFRSSFIFDLLMPVSPLFSKPVKTPFGQVEQIKVLKDEIQVLKTEVKRLNKELETREDFTHEYIEAKNIFFEGNKIQINKGTSEGVSDNKQVIVGSDIIGNVILTEKHRSLVGLLNNTQVKNLCFARHNETDVWGVLTADKSENVILTKIMQEKKIEVHDKVYCDGFYAGEISKIIKESSELFYEAEVVPSLNAENLETVYVVSD